MIYGYGLVYAQKYLSNNVKLPKIAQDEVKELLLKELVDDICMKFIEAKCRANKKAEMLRLSLRMNRLSKYKMFWKVADCCYKMEFIHEIMFYKYDYVINREED
jgi:hypothetical protein